MGVKRERSPSPHLLHSPSPWAAQPRRTQPETEGALPAHPLEPQPQSTCALPPPPKTCRRRGRGSQGLGGVPVTASPQPTQIGKSRAGGGAGRRHEGEGGQRSRSETPAVLPRHPGRGSGERGLWTVKSAVVVNWRVGVFCRGCRCNLPQRPEEPPEPACPPAADGEEPPAQPPGLRAAPCAGPEPILDPGPGSWIRPLRAQTCGPGWEENPFRSCLLPKPDVTGPSCPPQEPGLQRWSPPSGQTPRDAQPLAGMGNGFGLGTVFPSGISRRRGTHSTWVLPPPLSVVACSWEPWAWGWGSKQSWKRRRAAPSSVDEAGEKESLSESGLDRRGRGRSLWNKPCGTRPGPFPHSLCQIFRA
ncbi:hypothetical protein P7K49_010417, partial [Saguinus oedipus]